MAAPAATNGEEREREREGESKRKRAREGGARREKDERRRRTFKKDRGAASPHSIFLSMHLSGGDWRV